MIYALYHTVTDTEMDSNGRPAWVDTLGGILDACLLAATVYGVSILL